MDKLPADAALGRQARPFDRAGPLSLSVNQSGGFVRSDPAQREVNLQLYFSPVSYTKTAPQYQTSNTNTGTTTCWDRALLRS